MEKKSLGRKYIPASGGRLLVPPNWSDITGIYSSLLLKLVRYNRNIFNITPQTGQIFIITSQKKFFSSDLTFKK